jgi:hypothetical protein
MQWNPSGVVGFPNYAQITSFQVRMATPFKWHPWSLLEHDIYMYGKPNTFLHY